MILSGESKAVRLVKTLSILSALFLAITVLNSCGGGGSGGDKNTTDLEGGVKNTTIFSDDFGSGNLNKWTIGGRQEGDNNIAEIVDLEGNFVAHLHHKSFTEITIENTYDYNPNLTFAFDMKTKVSSQASSTSSFYAMAGVIFRFYVGPEIPIGHVYYYASTSSWRFDHPNDPPSIEYIRLPNDDEFHSYSFNVLDVLSNIDIDENLISKVQIIFQPYASGWSNYMIADVWVDNVTVHVLNDSGQNSSFSPNETPEYTKLYSNNNGIVSVLLDSGEIGQFKLKNENGSPVEGILSTVYKDNKGATIIAYDESNKYAPAIKSVNHFSTQEVQLIEKDNNFHTIYETSIIPNHLDTFFLEADDNWWERHEGDIDYLINKADSYDNAITLVDVVTTGVNPIGEIFKAIVFHDIKEIKSIIDWSFSDDYRYVAQINSIFDISILKTETSNQLGTLILRIEDNQGRAIANANVDIEPIYHAVTEYNGYARIEGIPAGTYEIKVTHDDYYDPFFFNSVDINIEAGRTGNYYELVLTHLPPDHDGDGWPEGTDCDNNNPSVNPGATEVCYNNIDDDCNGSIDEGCSASNESQLIGTWGITHGKECQNYWWENVTGETIIFHSNGTFSFYYCTNAWIYSEDSKIHCEDSLKFYSGSSWTADSSNIIADGEQIGYSITGDTLILYDSGWLNNAPCVDGSIDEKYQRQ